MLSRKIMASAVALALASAPAAAAPTAPALSPASEQAGEAGESQLLGTGSIWIILGVVAAGIILFLVLDDDDEPVSP